MDQLSEKIIPLIVSGEAKKYNPICLYGKPYQVEHFSETLQLACLAENPHTSICSLSGDSFRHQFVHSIRGDYKDTFLKRIRMSDMLIFTNVEAIQGSKFVMWEFFSMFDYYYERGKMIVVGSSVPYASFFHSSMEDRVVAQLQGGLVISLEDN